jgi:hypothetical protein
MQVDMSNILIARHSRHVRCTLDPLCEKFYKYPLLDTHLA